MLIALFWGFVVYREVDEYQVGIVAQHLGVAAVNAYVGAGRADSRVDVVHLCVGVLVSIHLVVRAA